MGCELADTFALVVQGMLGVLALASLVWKRYIETPPRPMVVWLMDTSKQATGGGTAHLTNVLLGMFMGSIGAGSPHSRRALQALVSRALSESSETPSATGLVGDQAALNEPMSFGLGSEGYIADINDGSSDQCVWYLIFLTLECTLGVAVLCSFLFALNYYAERYFVLKHFVNGDYGDPPRVKLWIKQLLAYQALLLVMKVVLASLVISMHTFLLKLGRGLLGPLQAYPKLQLLVVMVVVPLVLTIFSFWIQDNVLMSSEHFDELREPGEPDAESGSREVGGSVEAGRIVRRRRVKRRGLTLLADGFNSSAGSTGLSMIETMRVVAVRAGVPHLAPSHNGPPLPPIRIELEATVVTSQTRGAGEGYGGSYSGGGGLGGGWLVRAPEGIEDNDDEPVSPVPTARENGHALKSGNVSNLSRTFGGGGTRANSRTEVNSGLSLLSSNASMPSLPDLSEAQETSDSHESSDSPNRGDLGDSPANRQLIPPSDGQQIPPADSNPFGDAADSNPFAADSQQIPPADSQPSAAGADSNPFGDAADSQPSDSQPTPPLDSQPSAAGVDWWATESAATEPTAAAFTDTGAADTGAADTAVVDTGTADTVASSAGGWLAAAVTAVPDPAAIDGAGTTPVTPLSAAPVATSWSDSDWTLGCDGGGGGGGGGGGSGGGDDVSNAPL
mmetsp:Transcript_29110/g.73049  ORF Transcript_29110/g.73049 Transcript_29110/m.73049 type:complete len:674 (+) Transcript_29110:121-2142(+)